MTRPAKCLVRLDWASSLFLAMGQFFRIFPKGPQRGRHAFGAAFTGITRRGLVNNTDFSVRQRMKPILKIEISISDYLEMEIYP